MGALERDDPQKIGRYRLVEQLGAGGMGRVFLGVSPGGKKVAVKLVHHHIASDPDFRRRFAREVQAARRVGGFHSAQVIDADTDAVPPWMVTAYIPGPSLYEAVQDHGPMGAKEVRALGAALAEGLAAIHQCGLVHRDFKPANIIMAADGPRIMDFGIAHLLDANSTLTATGTFMGTAQYMSPEQVKGENVGPQSDVFSLGSVLTYAATGHGPFDAPTPHAAMYSVRWEVEDLRGVPGSLREVITSCLVKTPEGRPSVDQLVDLLAAPGTPASPRAPKPSPKSADKRQAKAGPQPRADAVTAPPPVRARPPAPAKPKKQASDGAGRSKSRTSTISLKSAVLEKQADVAQPAAVTFSPDNRIIAVAGAFGPGRTPEVRFWDALTGRLDTPPASGGKAKAITHPAASLFFSPNGRFLACQSGFMPPQLWAMSNRRPAWPSGVGAPSTPGRLTFSPDGKLLAVIHEDKQLRLWDAATLRPLGSPLLATPRIRVPIFSPDARLLAFPDTDETMRFWDVSNPRTPRRLPVDCPAGATRIVFSRDSTLVGVARSAARNRVKPMIFNLATGHRQGGQLNGGGFPVNLLRFSPNGTFLAAGNSGYQPSNTARTFAFWDVTEAEPAPRTVKGLTGVIKKIAFSPDGRLLAVLSSAARPDDSSENQVIHLWNLTRNSLAVDPAACTTQRPTAVLEFSRDGRFLVTGSSDRSVSLMNIETMAFIDLTEKVTGCDPVAAFSPDGMKLVTVGPGALRLWDLRSL